VDAAIKDKAGCVGAALRQIIIKTPSGRVGLAVTDPEAPAFEGWGVAVGFATLSWKAASYRGACLKDTRPETQQGAGPFTVQPLGSVIHLFPDFVTRLPSIVQIEGCSPALPENKILHGFDKVFLISGH